MTAGCAASSGYAGHARHDGFVYAFPMGAPEFRALAGAFKPGTHGMLRS